MKKLFLVLSITFYSFIYSQNLEFKVNESMSTYVGKENNFDDINVLKTPINVSLQDNILKLEYENGKTYLETEILDSIFKEDIKYGEKEREYHILKVIIDSNYISYIIIEKGYTAFDKGYKIKIPLVLENGYVAGYTIFSYYDY